MKRIIYEQLASRYKEGGSDPLASRKELPTPKQMADAFLMIKSCNSDFCISECDNVWLDGLATRRNPRP